MTWVGSTMRSRSSAPAPSPPLSVYQSSSARGQVALPGHLKLAWDPIQRCWQEAFIPNAFSLITRLLQRSHRSLILEPECVCDELWRPVTASLDKFLHFPHLKPDLFLIPPPPDWCKFIAFHLPLECLQVASLLRAAMWVLSVPRV